MAKKSLIMLIISMTIIVGFICNSAQAVNDEEIKRIIDNAPGKEEFPEASLIYLKTDNNITISPEGEATKEVFMLIKILQDRARDWESDRKISFDGKKEKVTLLSTRTHLPDGTILEPDEDGITEMSEMEAANAPFYSNARLKIVSYPGVTPGATLELHYRIDAVESEEDAEKQDEEIKYFQGQYLFQKDEPVMNVSFTVNLPEEQPFYYRMLNSDKKPAIEKDNGMTSYSWSFSNLEQILRDNDTVPDSMISPRLLYSSVDDWDIAAEWLKNKFLTKIKVTDEVKELAEEIAGDKETLEEKIKAVTFYIIRDVRNINLKLGKVGYEPTEPDRIIANKYGDIRDKTLLYLCLLKAVGVPAEPVFTTTEDDPFIDIPVIDQFDTIMICVKPHADAAWRWIYPGSENNRYGTFPNRMSRRRALMISDQGYSLTHTPFLDAEFNHSKIKLDLTLDETGKAEGKLTAEFRGMADSYCRMFLRRNKDSQMKNMFVRWANHIKKGSRLIEYEFSDFNDLNSDAKLMMAFSNDNMAFVQDDVIMMDIMSIPFWFIYAGTWMPSKESIDLPVISSHETSYVFTVNVSWTGPMSVGYAPQDFIITTKPFRAEIDSVIEDDKLIINRSFSYHRAIIQPDEFTELFEKANELNEEKNSLIIWEKDSGEI